MREVYKESIVALKVIMTKGIPGSGKSTWAKSICEENPDTYVRVNKDDLRAMLLGKWNKNIEKFIEEAEEVLVWQAFEAGKNIIIDNTHFNSKHEERFRKLVEQWNSIAENWNNRELKNDKGEVFSRYELEVKFFDVNLNTALIRNAGRTNPVPERTIRDMYNKYIRPLKEVKLKIDYKLPFCIICDLDGTLCKFSGNPYDRNFLEDSLNTVVWEILNNNRFGPENDLILVSGRNDKYREITEEWFKKYDVRYEALYMRKDGDVRKDVDIKREIYQNHILGRYNVSYVLDDRDCVVELWRSLGLTCLQVSEGNF